MTVVLLDPTRPDLIPAGAAGLLTGTVQVTEDVHPTLLWQLPAFVLVDEDSSPDLTTTLISSEADHPVVLERIRRGDRVVKADPVVGGALMTAVDLMDKLRRTGPWEGRQTHDSLRRYLLEEVYEFLDVIDHGTPDQLKSELGDLLLQVLFHARIAQDAAVGAFTIDDVAQSFVDKVSYRTPGVLAGTHSDLERQIDEWEAAKAAERISGSVLDGVVTGQPALALTQKVFERLAAVDFPVVAISPSVYRVDVPFRKHASVSVEDEQRRRTIGLMEMVRAAEAAAAADGVQPRDENTWRKYLGLDYVASPEEDGPEQEDSATNSVDGAGDGAGASDLAEFESAAETDGAAIDLLDAGIGMDNTAPDSATANVDPARLPVRETGIDQAGDEGDTDQYATVDPTDLGAAPGKKRKKDKKSKGHVIPEMVVTERWSVSDGD